MRTSFRPPHFLHVMQVNMGRGGAAHEAAINLAYEEGIDLILVQEPWIHSNLDRCIPKKHPAYSCFTPTEKWDKKPRVLTYVQVVNIYNAPYGSTDPGWGVECLLNWTPPTLPMLLAGDLNLRHAAWQPGSSLNRTAKYIEPIEPYDPLAVPPWAHTTRKEDSQIGFVSGHTKEQAAWDFKRWLQKQNPLDLVVYTDRSQTTYPRRAAGGLQNAITCFQARFANNVFICLDNLEVARTLGSLVNTSSQQAFTQFQEAEKAWQAREKLPHMSKGKVIIRWVPGHAGVVGNEKADQEAKTAAAKAAGSPTA
ncbi:hypothetical protein VTO42DRAFT_2645 [Malbranchea cinnamomea]